MSIDGNDPKVEAISESDNSWIGKLFVVAIVLYFARMAMPMLGYYDNLGVGTIMWNNADGVFDSAFALVMMWSRSALGFITIGIPVLTYLARNDPTVDTVGLGFVALGPLGWYIGSSFSEAYARKAACNSQSFFGFGCTLDGEPMLSFFVFSIIVVCVAVAAGIMLLGFALKAFNN